MKAITLLVCCASAAALARASAAMPFDAAQFERAQADGRPVLVRVHADWCRACKRQKRALDELLLRPGMADYRRFAVDFDKQKKLLMQLQVYREGTLVVYRGGREVGRSIGQTDSRKIAALLDKAL